MYDNYQILLLFVFILVVHQRQGNYLQVVAISIGRIWGNP